MPRKKDAATELAEKMLQALEARRRLGADSYPLTLGRLAELADPAAPAELVRKAAAKKKPFGERALAVQPKDLESPVALAEDADRLAASPLLLDFVLRSACTPSSPTCDVAKLKSKVPVRLRPSFEAALGRRIQDNNLPPGVAVIPVKRKKHLHLLRYPLPTPPEVELAESLVRVLQAQRRLGGDAYPLTLSRLVELTRPGVEAPLLKKAAAQPVFRGSVLLAVKGRPETPVALAEDLDLLAGSGLLLETALALARSEANLAFTPVELGKKLIPALRQPVAAAVRRQVERRSLPATVGWLVHKNRPLLFLLADVRGAATGGPRPAGRAGLESVPAVAPAAPARPAADLARAFDEAFERLDRQAGAHNFVSLVDLRRALPVDRQTFDTALGDLRRAGRYTLSAAEGRHGIRPEERDAGVYEDGAVLLYVSRRLS